MDFNITKENSSEEIVDIINQYGLAVCHNYIEDVSAIKQECEKIISETEEKDYLFGKAARIGSAALNQQENPNMSSFFGQQWMYNLFYQCTNRVPNFNEIFVQHDYRNDQGVSRNGVLHFDRLWTFKYMLYLTDVDETCGPFSVIPGTHVDGSFLRTQATEKAMNEYDQIKNWPLVDYPELEYTEDHIVPITGKAGTLIIFETDLFHLGGVLEDEKDRLIIRSHIRG